MMKYTLLAGYCSLAKQNLLLLSNEIEVMINHLFWEIIVVEQRQIKLKVITAVIARMVDYCFDSKGINYL